MNAAACALLWCGGALDVFVWGRVLRRRWRRRVAPRRSPPPTTGVGSTCSVLRYGIVPSDLWQSEAEVLAEVGVKLRRSRELIAEHERADALIEPGIRDVEDYLRRATEHGNDGGS